MGKYIAKRLLLLIPTTLLVCVIIFALLRMLPGDAVWGPVKRRSSKLYVKNWE